jgi:hypothetical protein
MEDALGAHTLSPRGHADGIPPRSAHQRLYLFALERGFLDSALERVIVEPFTRAARALTRVDRMLCGALPDSVRPAAADGEDRDE